MHRIITIFLFVIFAFQSFGQHRPLYSQYMFNGLVINPAYAGYNNALTAAILAKKQMAKFPGTPFTQTFTIHSPIGNKKANLGLLMVHDQFGIANQTEVSGNFAYRIRTSSEGRLAFGVQAGIAMIKNKWKDIILSDDKPDDAFDANYNNVVMPKLGLGIFYNTNNFYAGISIPQLVFYNKNYSNLNNTNYYNKLYYLTSGYNFKCSDNFTLKPSILFKYLKGTPMQVDLNAMVSYNNFISLGASYRTHDAFIFLVEYKKDQFSFGYAYDYILNNLKNYTNGSHELMIKYEFRYVVKATSPRDFR